MKQIDLNEYQLWAAGLAVYPNVGDNLYYPTLGLTNEAGEVAGVIKKIMRDQDGVLSPEVKSHLAKELGDVAWYLAVVAYEANIPLNTIFALNQEKLEGRKARGTLKGSGEDR